MKFSIFGTSHIRMEWIKSPYEDKHLILKEKNLKVFYNQIIHVYHCMSHCTFSIVSWNAMRKSVPRAECVFEHTLKMSPWSSKIYIHNRVTKRLFRPLHWHLSFRIKMLLLFFMSWSLFYYVGKALVSKSLRFTDMAENEMKCT
jgi:hypothetical protein